MRSLGTRRVAPAAGAAMIAVIALGGCSSGQVAETALLKAPISGLNTQSPDGNLLIRNLQVAYTSPEGYPAGGSAPVELSLFNQTEQPMTVLISSRPPQAGTPGVVSARQVVLGGGSAAASPSANPEPSGSRPPANSGLPSEQVPDSGEPSTPAGPPSAGAEPSGAVPPPADGGGEPARITIQPLSSAVYLPGGAESIQLVGLSDELRPGNSVNLVFEIGGNPQPVEVLAPVAVPLSPASRAPGADIEHEE